MVDDPVPERN